MNATRSKPSHRRQQMWVCIVAGLFLCDFILCGYLPVHQRLASLQEARAQQKRTLNMAATQEEELTGLQTRLEEAHRIVERFDSLVAPDSTYGPFLQQITAVMTECGLTDQVVVPGKELAADELGCIPIQITCKGTLTNLFDFFTRFQALDRLVREEKVMLENDAGFSGRITMEAEAVIFYQLKPLKATQNTAKADTAGGSSHGA